MSPRILPALLLMGVMTGCGQGPHLEGSVTPLLDLRYETAQAGADEDEASVRFLTLQGAGENTILKVAARLDDLQLAPGVAIDLAELLGEEPDSPQRGAVSRSVLDEPTREFPRLLRGGLTFDKPLTAGAKVPGEFHVTFVNGTDVYSGRTIFGRFEATVP
ncbi:hypothetical protein [Hyalangium sp.]|uniref:hypothetical protein n=1 Tax=Hyalangium sp. TaxID=2028555 RepID=UPI002D4B5EFA|nr:hypothetical protein [Hyalangium sp.]HYI02606.1 hypothetical protein [Hyalangium sp.]